VDYDPKNDKPANETMIGLIWPVCSRGNETLMICRFVVATEIPHGHDAIIGALLRRKEREPSFSKVIDETVAAVMAKQIHARKQAQIAALAKTVLEVNPKWAAGSGRADLGVFRMFHLFTYAPAQLVHYFGEEGANGIREYFASVGLTHGERLDRELEAELRQMGLWRDRAAFDPFFSSGNKS
jgi:hypothetical protein